MENFDISPLIKAKSMFDEFRQNLVRNQDKAGAVQSFEYTYELSLRYMKKVLAKRGLEVGSPKQTVRKAREEGIINNVEDWITFIELRNLTAHIDNEINMQKVIDIFELFSNEVDALIKTLQHIKE